MALVIEEVFILQTAAIIVQAIVGSMIVNRLKPLIARKEETLFSNCDNISVGCGPARLRGFKERIA